MHAKPEQRALGCGVASIAALAVCFALIAIAPAFARVPDPTRTDYIRAILCLAILPWVLGGALAGFAIVRGRKDKQRSAVIFGGIGAFMFLLLGSIPVAEFVSNLQSTP